MPMEWTSFTLKEQVPKSLQSPCINTAPSPQGSPTCQLLLTCARLVIRNLEQAGLEPEVANSCRLPNCKMSTPACSAAVMAHVEAIGAHMEAAGMARCPTAQLSSKLVQAGLP